MHESHGNPYAISKVWKPKFSKWLHVWPGEFTNKNDTYQALKAEKKRTVFWTPWTWGFREMADYFFLGGMKDDVVHPSLNTDQKKTDSNKVKRLCLSKDLVGLLGEDMNWNNNTWIIIYIHLGDPENLAT